MFGNGELFSIYRTNFLMHHNFGYDMTWFEGMVPYERELYIHMLTEQLEKDKQRLNK